jgi:hypothetical protein
VNSLIKNTIARLVENQPDDNICRNANVQLKIKIRKIYRTPNMRYSKEIKYKQWNEEFKTDMEEEENIQLIEKLNIWKNNSDNNEWIFTLQKIHFVITSSLYSL